MEERLKEIVKRLCRLALSEKEKEDLLCCKDCDLKEDLGFDSLLMVELIVEIEEAFGFEFEVDSMDMKKMLNFGHLLSLVENKGLSVPDKD